MAKTFNELFDDFFKRNNINPTDKIPDTLKEDAKRMIDLLNNIQDLDANADDIEKEIDKNLGKPDKIEFYSEGGFFYEKRIWHTPSGDMVQIIISEDPTLPIPPPIPKSLQIELDEAIAEEDYEKAALIRDKMNLKKK